jgi:hypothetical protein
MIDSCRATIAQLRSESAGWQASFDAAERSLLKLAGGGA